MAKVAIDWDRNLDPNKKVCDFEDDVFALIPQIVTYGTYPIQDIVRETIVKVR